MAIFGDFLGPAFAASRVQHLSDLHSKFALGPHDVWANAQRDGRPAEQMAPSIQRRKVWLTPTTTCRAVTLPRREDIQR